MTVQENTTISQTSQAGALAENVELQQGSSRVSCDGGGALGHPVIWLTLTTRQSGGVGGVPLLFTPLYQ